MRLLPDMNVSVAVARHLRSEGHDAVHLLEHGLERLQDWEVFRKATDEGRIPVTCDLDFSQIASQSPTLCGVVLLRLRSNRAVKVLPRLEHALQSAGTAVGEGAVVTVDHQRIRVRPMRTSRGM